MVTQDSISLSLFSMEFPLLSQNTLNNIEKYKIGVWLSVRYDKIDIQMRLLSYDIFLVCVCLRKCALIIERETHFFKKHIPLNSLKLSTYFGPSKIPAWENNCSSCLNNCMLCFIALKIHFRSLTSGMMRGNMVSTNRSKVIKSVG